MPTPHIDQQKLQAAIVEGVAKAEESRGTLTGPQRLEIAVDVVVARGDEIVTWTGPGADTAEALDGIAVKLGSLLGRALVKALVQQHFDHTFPRVSHR